MTNRQEAAAQLVRKEFANLLLLLRTIDDDEGVDVSVDQRWRAIANTHIEQAEMAILRAIELG